MPLTHDARWRVNEEAREALRVMRGGKHSEHLTAIPRGVITPEPQPPAVTADISPVPRPHVTGAPARPSIANLILQPRIYPETVEAMTEPAAGPHPRVAIVTTKGTLILELFPEWAPETVTNFLRLANRGFYDGVRWFRVVPDFVAQSGDRTNRGDGDAGYRIGAEENPLDQDAGVISMGLDYDKKGPERDSAGSQFYITISPQLHLDRDFTVFGRVEEGFDVLGRIVESDRIIRIEEVK
jgi:peptidyl-prolyl cis-trans isomerase B (cyclophilin B)